MVVTGGRGTNEDGICNYPLLTTTGATTGVTNGDLLHNTRGLTHHVPSATQTLPKQYCIAGNFPG